MDIAISLVYQYMPEDLNMSANLPYGKQRADRVDGRLFLTDENLDRGMLSLMAAARRIENHMREMAQKSRVSQSELSVLLELRHAPGIDVAELRERLGGTTPTIARLLGELNRKHLIERPRNSEDGRRRSLTLSGQGNLLMDELLASLRKDMIGIYRTAGEPAVSGALELLQAVSEISAKDSKE